jgi:hypothetical protein
VASKIIPAAEKKLKITVPCKGSPDDLCLSMKRSGISKLIVLPLAKGKVDVLSLNDWIQSVSGDGLQLFGASSANRWPGAIRWRKRGYPAEKCG